ncbi:ABC transporter permease [Sphaerobacter thermophilus]|uniref:Uncharacterized protein n=1 Tax=Sphaerobacter thermophilus (strain ATCC 49802 / DSM 20745 / KCCM 41009 / NCIMB 13125 / S 6022) TaxID=479434 RepID=D1C279_SPHTD|nr:ABC transporter permease [Sphaerobacter thermophilus]ACZ38346.1 hypothetical protein Sthe_0909 [Sphaerobacter thermophilus DSM 20745]
MASGTNTLTAATLSASDAIRGRPGVAALTRMELGKLRKRPMTKVTFGLGILAAVGFMVLVLVAGTDGSREAFVFPNIVEDSFQLIQLMGNMTLPVIGAAIAGSEYGWGTMRLLLATGVGRGPLFAAKLLALLVVDLLFVLMMAVLICVEAACSGWLGGYEQDLSVIDGAWVADAVQLFATTTGLLFFLVIVAFGVAMLGRSMAAGIAVGIGLPIAQQIAAVIAPAVFGRLGELMVDFFPNTSFQALAMRAGFDPAPAEGLLSPERAIATLVGYSVLILGVAALVFWRRDVPSGD